MRAFRARSSLATTIVLTWQIIAVMFVPTALCCRLGEAAPVEHEHQSAMADCPMEHAAAAATDAACPLHSQQTPGQDCDCPTLGCSQTDNGFMALYGPIGVLAAPVTLSEPSLEVEAASIVSQSTDSLAPIPVAPPPRA
jgi:hypothetical protein